MHLRRNVPRNSIFSAVWNRIAVGESIVTGNLLPLKLALDSRRLGYKERNLPGYLCRKRQVASEICIRN